MGSGSGSGLGSGSGSGPGPESGSGSLGLGLGEWEGLVARGHRRGRKLFVGGSGETPRTSLGGGSPEGRGVWGCGHDVRHQTQTLNSHPQNPHPSAADNHAAL